jgi:hypothetical protein
LVITSDGEIKPGSHYALTASVTIADVNTILKENKNSLQKVALAAGSVPTSMSGSSFADSGCTTHFFKNKDVFTSYQTLTKVEGQSSKEGTSFKILGSGNVKL